MPDYTVEIHVARERLQAANEDLAQAQAEQRAAPDQLISHEDIAQAQAEQCAAQSALDWLISQQTQS